MTSTAGVAEGTWSQKIVDRVRYYRVTGFDYRDQMTLDGLPPILSCTPSSSQNNTTTHTPSGAPYDGALGRRSTRRGPLERSLIAQGQVGKTAAFTGCKLNDDASNWIHCPLTRWARAASHGPSRSCSPPRARQP